MRKNGHMWTHSVLNVYTHFPHRYGPRSSGLTTQRKIHKILELHIIQETDLDESKTGTVPCKSYLPWGGNSIIWCNHPFL